MCPDQWDSARGRFGTLRFSSAEQCQVSMEGQCYFVGSEVDLGRPLPSMTCLVRRVLINLRRSIKTLLHDGRQVIAVDRDKYTLRSVPPR